MDQTGHVRDPYETPPQQLKEIFKRYQKLSMVELDSHPDVIDCSRPDLQEEIESLDPISSSRLNATFHSFAPEVDLNGVGLEDILVHGHKRLPEIGSFKLYWPAEKRSVLMIKTNIHLHYNVPYHDMEGEDVNELEYAEAINSRSFFSYSPVSDVYFSPRDPAVHRPLPIGKLMQKSLRWITLGGQYDWTNKVYPKERAPKFPSDIGQLLEGLFPEMKAQAAIINLYTPGDTLSLHRDVSEESDKGLASISFGCDCIFVIGQGQESDGLVIRLRSGDGVFMSKEARFAWHGVPRIIPDTCPEYLWSWPAESGKYEDWRGWMSKRRINLNVRQMYD